MPAIVAVRPTLYRSLRVSVSLPLADALLAWQQNRNIIVAASLALIALTLMGGALSQWQFNRLADARAALARSVATLDEALAVMPDGFLLCDKDDRVVRWNERYLEMVPWVRDIIRVGVPFAELARPPRRDADDRGLRRAAPGSGWRSGWRCTAPARATGNATSATASSSTSPTAARPTAASSACSTTSRPPSAGSRRPSRTPRPPTRPSRSSWRR